MSVITAFTVLLAWTYQVHSARIGRHSSSSRTAQSSCECGRWNYFRNECSNPDQCEQRWEFGDITLSQSCKCKDRSAEYDCDGDGVAECDGWNLYRAECKQSHMCGYQFKAGDDEIDQSCRCKPECRGDKLKDCEPLDEYDCDGDGADDCGTWDSPTASCSNPSMCQKKFKLGDWSNDQSCRCRPCARTSSASSPALDTNLAPTPNKNKVGGSGNWGKWQNWADHMDTCAPWMMPTNDNDLRKLLDYAARKGYTVRPSGAGHSAGGLVNDGDDKVMVVSLGGYTAPGEWQWSLDEAGRKMKVNAGWSQLDVYERIRPKGLFFPTQTAGYFFQIAGVIANSVHGAGYKNSFVHSYVTKMRVMLHDGSIKIITDANELKYWRNSYGLLGLILGVEMKLVERSKYQMYTKQTEYAWSETNYWKFILRDAEADLPSSVSRGLVSGGSRKSIAGEFFINLLPDKPGFIVYANKENGNATEPGFASGIPGNIASNYEKLRNEKVRGTVRYGESVRKEGCPALYLDPFQVVNVNRLVGSKLVPSLARVIEPIGFSSQTLKNLGKLVQEQADNANDGFFAVRAPNTLIAAYFIKPERSFEAMDFLREAVKRRNGQATWFKAEGFSWNQPAEFRFMQVTDDAVLQPVPPGLWFVSEILSFPDAAATDQEWKKAFKEVEDYWINELGAIPHLGKLFGFEEENGQIEMFSQKKTCKVYSTQQKNDFKAYHAKVDPNNRFFAGLGEQLLRGC